MQQVQPNRFLPSSRSVAFAKEAVGGWRLSGGDYSEDLVFDLRLREAGYPFAWVPEAIVHFRPRRDLRSFMRQYYQYARGDGKADLWRVRHAIRYSAYSVGLAGIILGGLLPTVLIGLAMAGALYVARPYRRLLRLGGGWTAGQRLAAAALVPLLRAAGDLAKMAGYPVGVRWRQQQRNGHGWRDH
jgi:hypothetical protein